MLSIYLSFTFVFIGACVKIRDIGSPFLPSHVWTLGCCVPGVFCICVASMPHSGLVPCPKCSGSNARLGHLLFCLYPGGLGQLSKEGRGIEPKCTLKYVFVCAGISRIPCECLLLCALLTSCPGEWIPGEPGLFSDLSEQPCLSGVCLACLKPSV